MVEVRIECSCAPRRGGGSGGGDAETETHALASLLFCDSAACGGGRLKCGRCVSSDAAAFFCPNCLFEVPSASVKAERNRFRAHCRLPVIGSAMNTYVRAQLLRMSCLYKHPDGHVHLRPAVEARRPERSAHRGPLSGVRRVPLGVAGGGPQV
ncbi:hypothetical protein HK100_000006 [Physocladia obscura]|uniref:Dynactin subunit 4 n=1 Tax=Physocladia obscura TaxID=109957 RepID=A0AAD5XLI9_9FUNG|nr:hypothetical protein HK100_000006 [Physocladia obscura]